MHYDIKWIEEEFGFGKTLNFLFFWGHTSKNEQVGKECLSQWYPASFTFDNIIYKTSEHWMMAQKALLFKDRDIFEKIIKTETTKEVKSLGRQIKNFSNDIWNESKFKIVKTGNIHKFTQNPKLLSYIKSTEGQVLVEASPVDKIWGIGLAQDAVNVDNPYFWDGENLLGFALMEVRDYVKKFESFALITDPVLPIWKKYPNIHIMDMFWRMGEGEDYILKFSNYWRKLSQNEQEIYKLMFPSPSDWELDWYKL